MKLEPDDARQALRLRRLFMAAGTALLLPALLLVAAAAGAVELRVAGVALALIAAFVALFFVLIRSGLNRRFPDPSLTGTQIFAAIVCVAYVASHAGAARPLVAMFYLMAMMFGALRMGAGQLVALALVAVLAHGAALLAWERVEPGVDRAELVVEIAALAVILPWFAAMGAYVNSLRTRLSDSKRRLQHAFERIGEIAIRDELTGVYNRRFLMEVLGREHARAARLGSCFSVCLFDLDHFKSINDGFGHAEGDAVLKGFAGLALADLRQADVFGRHGGEEFLLVMPDTGAEGARVAGERVRGALAGKAAPVLPDGRRVTATVGVAALRSGESVEAVLARADAALYEGKSAGRDRVVVAG